mgnify:CR=1 FL=1
MKYQDEYRDPASVQRLRQAIRAATQSQHLYFYDAISPIIDADSIDMTVVFRASRYDKDSADYLNCPMTDAQYNTFYEALIEAEKKFGPQRLGQSLMLKGTKLLILLAVQVALLTIYRVINHIWLEPLFAHMCRTKNKPRAVKKSVNGTVICIDSIWVIFDF